jgi:hypothetical protein
MAGFFALFKALPFQKNSPFLAHQSAWCSAFEAPETSPESFSFSNWNPLRKGNELAFQFTNTKQTDRVSAQRKSISVHQNNGLFLGGPRLAETYETADGLLIAG